MNEGVVIKIVESQWGHTVRNSGSGCAVHFAVPIYAFPFVFFFIPLRVMLFIEIDYMLS